MPDMHLKGLTVPFETLVPWIAMLIAVVAALLVRFGARLHLRKDIADFATFSSLIVAVVAFTAGAAATTNWFLFAGAIVTAVMLALLLISRSSDEEPQCSEDRASEIAPESDQPALELPTMPVIGVVPSPANPGDAGHDLRYDPSALPITLHPGEMRLLPTGTRLALPDGTVGLLCPRSGLAVKHGIGIVNSPGVIDSGYRGDVGVTLINHGPEPITFSPGDRIAQLVIVPYVAPLIIEAESLDSTERGVAGFGSTGTE